MELITELKADSRVVAPVVAEAIDDVFTDEVVPIHSIFEDDHEILTDYMARAGKGFGGSLVLRCSQIFEEGEYSEAAIKFAAATEILNAYVLVIDDWLDGSAVRKSRPTVHERYKEYHAPYEIEQRLHVAEGQAVQLGMLAVQIADIITADPSLINSRYQRARLNMHRAALRVSTGNMLESRVALGIAPQTEETILSVYKNKTSQYSFIGPMVTGLLLAGANEQVIDAFNEFATPLGLAFQIQDDVAGIFGDPEITGKPNVDDVREGLYTMFFHETIQRLNQADRSRFESLHGRQDLTEQDLQEYKALVIKSGAKQYIEDLSLRYFEQARQKLDALWSPDWNPRLKAYIASINDFLSAKKY